MGTRCSELVSPPPDVQAGDQLAGDNAKRECQLEVTAGDQGGEGVIGATWAAGDGQ
eukprot:CAMPEP_0174366416 /NCGR_PEP_ID=MMETSP0811_2-20130205/81113_1 /TAXON_ID=73025 ORGANISM="Eutreptiella gymnastica-like, Strain CCMP1594" /NCGR_SAMPLE_ID=MMETSP0811_2 /ASSEMBLY_ACC=CAM_ASM_000667 /LENGTH=55 /DNA_ID=CAMNT_0015507953 /DNA_START=431 /DNA_END=595 /DNA_ORIENTATION=+